MNSQSASRWAVNLCNIKGIPIRIHASFLLLVAWVAMDAGANQSPIAAELLFVAAVFGCILLHELGHALVARRYSIKTNHITLYPFGGIAALAQNPTAKAELFVAAAGPAVNFVLAGIFYLFSSPSAPVLHEISGEILLSFPQSLSERLLIANVILAVFNLIPALPMDGGRILRASLEMAGVKNHTLISARLAKVISLTFIVISLYTGDTILLIICVLVFLGASQEQLRTQINETATGYKVGDALINRDKLVILPHGMTTAEAATACTRSHQKIFPVAHGDSVIGLISREALFSAGVIAKDPLSETQYVGDIMNRTFETLTEDQPLDQVLERMQADLKPPFVVMDSKKEKFLGLLEYDRLLEFLYVSRGRSDEELSRREDEEDGD